jgi:signal transduction histidine kinase/ActR/RegA family two-component response regulator
MEAVMRRGGMQERSGRAKSEKHRWFHNSVDRLGIDMEEVRKRRLYVLLSLPGIVFLSIWGIYNIATDNWLGGWFDVVAATMLCAGIFYLRRAKKAMSLYRLNSLMLLIVMLYWVMNGGMGGEKSVWGLTFPLIGYFMLGPVEGTLWNGAALCVICLMFFVDLNFSVYPYPMPFKVRYICAYMAIGMLTYFYEAARKEYWDNFFEHEKEKKELREKLARSQKMEALGLLAGGVAHDLNNVMFGLVSYPDYLLSKLDPQEPMYSSLNSIRESGQKAAAIVDELLTLARRGVTNTQVLDLNSLVEEYLDSPEHGKLKEFHAQVEIVALLGQDLKSVKGSPLHLKKCIMNLISNAVEALPSGGRVIVSTADCYVDRPIRGYSDVAQGDYVLLRVEDNGIGIAGEDLPHIFEPFYTKKIMGRSGTGLGMAVVWGSVQDHQGYIDVQSHQGLGTIISIYLPVCDEERVQAPQPLLPEAYKGAGERILIVDDMAEQRTITARMLADLGYVVHTAENGEAAVAFIQAQRVDLILLDMIMEPGIDGLETYRRILQIHPDQKAIIVSGFSESERVKGALKLGAGAYIKKPYTMEHLGLAVRAELGSDRRSS